MLLTAILIEPHRVTRVFFDGHDLAVGDQQRIAPGYAAVSLQYQR
jgi:hypothetical protein